MTLVLRGPAIRRPVTLADFGGDVANFERWRESERITGAWPDNAEFPTGWEERDAKGV